jgi:hypothetical protein
MYAQKINLIFVSEYVYQNVLRCVHAKSKKFQSMVGISYTNIRSRVPHYMLPATDYMFYIIKSLSRFLFNAFYMITVVCHKFKVYLLT